MHPPHFRSTLSQWWTPGWSLPVPPPLPHYEECCRESSSFMSSSGLADTFPQDLSWKWDFGDSDVYTLTMAEQWLVALKEGCTSPPSTNHEWMSLCLQSSPALTIVFLIVARCKFLPCGFICISLITNEFEQLFMFIGLFGFILWNLFSSFSYFSIRVAFFCLIWFYLESLLSSL